MSTVECWLFRLSLVSLRGFDLSYLCWSISISFRSDGFIFDIPTFPLSLSLSDASFPYCFRVKNMVANYNEYFISFPTDFIPTRRHWATNNSTKIGKRKIWIMERGMLCRVPCRQRWGIASGGSSDGNKEGNFWILVRSILLLSGFHTPEY